MLLLTVCVMALVGRVVSAFLLADVPGPSSGTLETPGAPMSRDDVSAWYFEHDDSLVIPDSLLATPLSTPRFVFRMSAGWPSVANRNSNPLNVKLGRDTQHHVAAGTASVSDIVPLDGGRFLKFASAEYGFRAARALLTGPGYGTLELDQALRRWSNNGYGAEIVATSGLGSQTLLSNLSREQLGTLLAAMATAEGYRSARLKEEVAGSLGH